MPLLTLTHPTFPNLALPGVLRLESLPGWTEGLLQGQEERLLLPLDLARTV